MKQPKKIRNYKPETRHARIQKMLLVRAEIINDGIEKYHVRMMPGNDKTGESCYTVSTLPVIDCYNCKECQKICYDLLNDCWRPDVVRTRAINSAIHKVDPERFWFEVDANIKALGVTELRYNVGGDFNYDDFLMVQETGENNPDCDSMFFTKSYDDLNKYIDEHIEMYPDNFGFVSNAHPLMSRWKGVPCNNPYGVPESHVLFIDGTTTAPEYGAIFCTDNCSECHLNKRGCWALKKGESVIFPAH